VFADKRPKAHGPRSHMLHALGNTLSPILSAAFNPAHDDAAGPR
jgi:hypothetical protein